MIVCASRLIPLPGKRLGDGLGPGGLVVQPQLGPGLGPGAEVEQVVEAGVQEVEQQPPPAQCGHVLGHRLGVEMSTNLSQCPALHLLGHSPC